MWARGRETSWKLLQQVGKQRPRKRERTCHGTQQGRAGGMGPASLSPAQPSLLLVLVKRVSGSLRI